MSNSSIVDEILKDAIESGAFKNLPGEGKPLKLEDETSVPEELRLAHRILRANDLAPDWIMDGKAISDTQAALTKEVRVQTRRYLKELREAESSSTPELNRQHINQRWDVTKAALRERINKLNKDILNFNLKVPRGVTHRPLFDLDREIARWG